MDLLCADESLMESPMSSWGEAFVDSDEILASSSSNLGSMESNFPVRNNEELQSVLAKESLQMLQMDYGDAINRFDVASPRMTAIARMLDVRNVHGFCASTAALGVSYFDRYLSQNLLRLVPFKQPWAIEIIALACISLAAKMEELTIPSFASLQNFAHLTFDPKFVKRMEMIILKALDWRMCSITPFDYVHDLLQRLDLPKHTKASVFARVSELILGSLPEPDFVTFRPSVVSLGAFICALEEIVPLQAEAFLQTLLVALPVDEAAVQRCYKTFEETVVDPVEPRRTFPNSPSPPSPLTVIETSSEPKPEWPIPIKKRATVDIVGPVPAKKRRLEFDLGLAFGFGLGLGHENDHSETTI